MPTILPCGDSPQSPDQLNLTNYFALAHKWARRYAHSLGGHEMRFKSPASDWYKQGTTGSQSARRLRRLPAHGFGRRWVPSLTSDSDKTGRP